MQKPIMPCRIFGLIIITSFFILTGCSNNHVPEDNQQTLEIQETGKETEPETTENAEKEQKEDITDPVIEKVDWSNYFNGIKGSAVIYDPASHTYQIYHQKLSLTRRLPCSTFKMISSLIALEHGMIVPDDSLRTWSGEKFWNDEWNRDIDFPNAFTPLVSGISGK